MLQNRFSMVAVFVLSAAVRRRGAAPAVGAGGKGIIPQGQQARLLSGVGHALGVLSHSGRRQRDDLYSGLRLLQLWLACPPRRGQLEQRRQCRPFLLQRVLLFVGLELDGRCATPFPPLMGDRGPQPPWASAFRAARLTPWRGSAILYISARSAARIFFQNNAFRYFLPFSDLPSA